MCVMQVLPLPDAYLQQHGELIREFQNGTQWPKHLLVRYHWVHANPVKVNTGLYVLFAVGKS